MEQALTFEAEPFSGYVEDPEAFGEIALESGGEEMGSYESGFDFQRELPARAACPGYQKGEVEKSRCQEGPCWQGILFNDVMRHPRGLLIADFGVGWHGMKAATKSEKLLYDWMREAKADLYSIILRIYGYTDCVAQGAEKNNLRLRAARAERAYGLLDKDLQSRVDFKGAAPTGVYIADNATPEDRARNRSALIELWRIPEETIYIKGKLPKPPTPCTTPGCKYVPPKPKPCTGPDCKDKPKPKDPDLPKPRKPWVWPWMPTTVIVPPPPDDDGGDSWVWKSLTSAAGFLGITISIGMRSLSKVELKDAIDAAWLVFQIEEGGLKAVIGLAGEAAAEAIISRALGIDAKNVYNLNKLHANFPVLDLIAPSGMYSVKTKGLLGWGARLDASLVQDYIQDIVNLAGSDHPQAKKKLADAADILFRNHRSLQRRGAWPRGFNPNSAADVAKYIRNRSKLLVPHDHVQTLRRSIGKALNARVQRGLRLPPGTNPVAWVNSWVDRIDSIGVKSTDLQVLLETARHHLPAEQVGRLLREYEALLRRRGL